MTQAQFSEYFGIPKRTIENWEGNQRKCPEYVLNLIEYKLRNERMLKPTPEEEYLKMSLIALSIEDETKKEEFFEKYKKMTTKK